ncbi:hypothetical protein [Streptococcus halichoeri]|uniref:hypothetical protein n=1 Tax=Streptococcus halichoeri TaxID=254785 RepID=UPI001C8D1D74|nr:hypothetical protein [Streptococcus halichoeri]
MDAIRIYARNQLQLVLEKYIYQAYENDLKAIKVTVFYPVDDQEAKRIIELCRDIPAVLDAKWLFGTVIFKVYLKH